MKCYECGLTGFHLLGCSVRLNAYPPEIALLLKKMYDGTWFEELAKEQVSV